MTYKTYEKYINIDNHFFELMPLDWNIYKLKYITSSLESGKRKDFDDTTYAFSLGGEHINWEGTLNLTNNRYISEDFYNSMNKGKIQENDVLLVKDGATIGKTAFVDNLVQKMAVNEHVFIVRHNNIVLPKLLYYLISSHIGFTQIKLTETGSAQGGISQDILDKVDFIIPSNLTLQKQMVNFLDTKVTKIDATIAKNKELIDLLEEKRVALINQLVTKGLNPDVPMKDSGVDIIGNIPKNNKIVRLKFLCNIKTGDKDTVNRNPDGKYPFYVRSPIVERIDTYSFDGEAVLMARDGVGAGKVFHYATGKFDYHQRVYNFHNFKHVVPKFIYYYMSSLFSIEIEKGSAKSTVDSVRLPMLEDFLICYPPINEQKQVIAYLDNETLKIDSIISKVKENIKLLDEYKTSLIHHVVTGKIDVRGEEI